MARATKRARRALRHVFAALGNAILVLTPRPVRERLAPWARYADMLLLDHLVIRIAFPNRHRLSEEAWRAAQPLPHQIAHLARLGVRTVVNLRGAQNTSTYAVEKAACERAGLILVDFPIRSRAAPARAEIHAIRDLFSRVDYPIAMHCKSGADRVGLMSVLYLHFRRGVPITEARRQLSLRYGHIRQADTGILDDFIERYLADSAKTPMDLLEWVDTVYDPDELKRSFRSVGWANRLVNSILKRE